MRVVHLIFLVAAGITTMTLAALFGLRFVRHATTPDVPALARVCRMAIPVALLLAPVGLWIISFRFGRDTTQASPFAGIVFAVLAIVAAPAGVMAVVRLGA